MTLPIYDPIIVKDKLPFSEDAYVELFHTCPRCMDPVPIKSGIESGVQALDRVWHREHFNCDECGDDFVDGKFFSNENKMDGRGKLPFCEGCYKTKFMPRCLGCNDHVLLDVDDVVEACGGFWHPEHFRCAKTGVVLEGDYMSHDNLPYSTDAYFECFGEKCTKCSLVIKEQAVSVLGQKWHPECFTCTSNDEPIPKNDEGQYVYFAHDLMPYCQEEYAKLFGSTCARCDKVIVSGEMEALGKAWHKECLTCEGCTRNLFLMKGGKVHQGPEEGMPYCMACYGRTFGDSCAACNFPLNPGEVPVKALDKIWHKQHFCCVQCSKSLYDESDNALEFFPTDGLPFCKECFLEFICQRCDKCGDPMRPGDDALTLQDDNGENRLFHRDCHRCVITQKPFTESDTIYMNDGYPYCEDAYKEVFADHVCSGCGDGIIGARQVALDKSWHPGHIGCASCGEELASTAIFVREEVALGGGKWPVCKSHMICKFEGLSEVGQSKLSGDQSWTDWAKRKSRARDLNEDFKTERASTIQQRTQSRSSRNENLSSALARPFSDIEQSMRESMGMASKKKQITSDASSAMEGGTAEVGKTEEAWVELKDNQGYTYYWNTVSDETSYNKPSANVEKGHGGSTVGEKGGGEGEGEGEGDGGEKVMDRGGIMWSVHPDGTGSMYYENLTAGGGTANTQWDEPPDLIKVTRLETEGKGGVSEEGGATRSSSSSSSSPAPSETWARNLNADGRASLKERASEWSQLTDDFGNLYYEHTKTNTTTWEKPIELAIVTELERLIELGELEEIEKEMEGVRKKEQEEEEEEEKEDGEGEKETSRPLSTVDETPPPLPPSDADRERGAAERAKEGGNANSHRRPSKIDVVSTMKWSANATVLDGQKGLHKQGYLKKKGAGKSMFGRKNWKVRYFVLSNGNLRYWKNESDFKSNEKPLKGCTYDTSGCVVEVDDGEKATDKYEGKSLFRVKMQNKQDESSFELPLLADSKEVREGWVNVLRMSSQS